MKKLINLIYNKNFEVIKEFLGDKFPNQDEFYIFQFEGLRKTKAGGYTRQTKYEVITHIKQLNDNTLKGMGFDLTHTIYEKLLYVVNRKSKTARPLVSVYDVLGNGKGK